MTENGGPAHDRDCLAASVRSSPCRCARRDWFLEEVPRYVARREAVAQLAQWALEQHTFTQADVPNLHGPFGVDPPKWVKDTLKVGANLTAEVYMDVRRRGLSMLDELKRIEDHLPKAAAPAATDDEDEPAEARKPERSATAYVEDDQADDPAALTQGDAPLRVGDRDVVSVPTQGALL